MGRGVSIIIPTHSGRESVLETVGALLDNDFNAMELIVVSDGGSPETKAVLETVDDARLKLIETVRGGAARARNAGLLEARFDWVAFVDDDDVPRPNWVSTWEAHAIEGVVAITAGLAHWRDGIFRKEKAVRLSPSDPGMRASTLMAGCFWMRRDMLLSIGGYDTTLKAAQNQDLGLRYLTLARDEGIPNASFVSTETVVIDVYAQEATSRMQRYGSSYADAAREFFNRYAERLRADPRTRADYLRIISRDLRREGERIDAVRAAVRACRTTPTDVRNYRALALAVLPWMEHLKRHKPRARSNP